MLASTKQKLTDLEPAIKAMLSAIREACEIFSKTEREKMPQEVSKRYGLSLQDATSWCSGVKIMAAPTISQAALGKAIETLKVAGVLPVDCMLRTEDTIDPRYVTLESDMHSKKPE